MKSRVIQDDPGEQPQRRPSRTPQTSPDRGVIGGGFPFVRFGTGPRPLVILPGLGLDNGVPSAVLARAYAYSFRRLAVDHTVHIVNRRPGLPSGASTSDIAAAYAGLLRDEIGPARVMAMSTGGLVAQHLAANHPDVVEQLVLVSTGVRIDDAGRAICARWRDLATQGHWRRLRGDHATAAVDSGQWFARLAGALSGGAPRPIDAADFVTTVDAVLAHDARDRLGAITAPTMVIGGGRDPFFLAATLRETADAIPGAVLRLHETAGHGLAKHHGGLVQEETLAFLGPR
jgi:pimeloyl-ACP methyl ester carboxylesterase